MISVSLVSILIFQICLRANAAYGSEWNYQNEESWSGKCSEGGEQSPINLSPGISNEINYPRFIFNHYDNKFPALIQNNGHAVEVRLHSNEIKPSIGGGGLPSSYFLDHLHLHWQSEHTIEGKRFPLELHLVHFDARRSSLAEALKHGGEVAVLSVLFYRSPDDDVELKPLWDAINRVHRRKVGEFEQVREIDLNDFLPRDRAGFYRYNGSLTTPSCDEGVIWTVFTNALPVSATQIRLLSMLRAPDGKFLTQNYRSTQDLNDRPVFFKSSDSMHDGGDRLKNVPLASSVLILLLLFVA